MQQNSLKIIFKAFRFKSEAVSTPLLKLNFCLPCKALPQKDLVNVQVTLIIKVSVQKKSFSFNLVFSWVRVFKWMTDKFRTS